MMRRMPYYVVTGIIVAGMLGLCGCDMIMEKISLRKKTTEKKPVVDKKSYIQDISLAESIMRAPAIDIALKRDPFRPLVKNIESLIETEPEEKTTLTLTGIYGGKTPIVLIKGTEKTYVVQERDYVEGFLIKKIMENKVLLERAGKHMILTIGGQEK